MRDIKQYDKVNEVINNMRLEEGSFYYKKLELVDKTNICPVCNEELKESIWGHALKLDTHFDFVKQQLEMCSKLFYNVWVNRYNIPKDKMIKGFYVSEKSVRTKYWRKWYSAKNRLKQANWEFIKENSYYNPDFTFDFNIDTCPICGENIKDNVFKHFSKAMYREDHQQILFQIIGAILHNDIYKGNEFYSFDNYHYVLKTIYGRDYKVNKIAKIPEKRKVLDKEKAIKESYYAGEINFEYKNGKCICPACKKEFKSKRYVLTHVAQRFQDPEHYDLLLRIYGDILNREKYSNNCCYNEQTFNLIRQESKQSAKQNYEDILKEYIPFKKE